MFSVFIVGKKFWILH